MLELENPKQDLVQPVSFCSHLVGKCSTCVKCNLSIVFCESELEVVGLSDAGFGYKTI